MKLRNTNYNLAHPVELIHKYQKDQELIANVESKTVEILSELRIPRSEHMSEVMSAVYFGICYAKESRTLGEEYSYLTHFHPSELIFVSRKRKLLYFLLKTLGVSIAKQ